MLKKKEKQQTNLISKLLVYCTHKDTQIWGKKVSNNIDVKTDIVLIAGFFQNTNIFLLDMLMFECGYALMLFNIKIKECMVLAVI